MPKIVAKKEDWVKLGYQFFTNKGIEGIVVERMAKKLNCNKSSFYWHFESRKKFIDELISFWVNKDTNTIIQLTESELTPIAKFSKLIELSYSHDPQLDFIFHLKRFARKNEKVQAILDQVDAIRQKFIAAILQEMGLSKAQAIERTTLFYKHLIGSHELMRYKKTTPDYIETIRQEINQFIPFL